MLSTAAQTGVLPAEKCRLEGQDSVLADREDCDIAIALALATASTVPLLIDEDEVPPTRTARETGLAPPERVRGLHHIRQVARVVVDLEAGHLVVLRAKNPHEPDRVATARRHAQTTAIGYYEGHRNPANPAQLHALP